MPFDPRVHVGTAAAIVDLEKRLLVVKRKGAHGEGQWALPGGWVDYGEKPEETIARELEEELDIRVPVSTLVLWDVVSTTFDSPVDTAITVLYGTKHWSRAWKPWVMEADKIEEFAWATVPELMDVDLFAPLRTLLTRPNNLLLNATIGRGFK